jgi:hypothetical protein
MDIRRSYNSWGSVAMNPYQKLWWEQSRSDHSILILLRRNGASSCHQLHYLQMVTEKLAKAYFWRTGTPPPRKHTGSVQFMRSLGGVQQERQTSIATALDFKSFSAFQSWIRNVLPMIYDLERLAPALALDGPIPEYPWPHNAPTDNPVAHTFALWGQLTGTAIGRQLVKVVGLAVDRFSTYG